MDERGVEEFCDAAMDNRFDAVKRMLESTFIKNVNATNRSGWSALHCASSSGRLKTVEYLIQEGGADVNVRSTHGYDFDYEFTPLHYAAENGHIEVCKYLISCGADIHALSHHGFKALDSAKEKGQVAVAMLLSRFSDGQGIDPSYESPKDLVSVLKDIDQFTPISPELLFSASPSLFRSPSLTSSSGDRTPFSLNHDRRGSSAERLTSLLSSSSSSPSPFLRTAVTSSGGISQHPSAPASPFIRPSHDRPVHPPVIVVTDTALDTVELSWDNQAHHNLVLVTRIECAEVRRGGGGGGAPPTASPSSKLSSSSSSTSLGSSSPRRGSSSPGRGLNGGGGRVTPDSHGSAGDDDGSSMSSSTGTSSGGSVGAPPTPNPSMIDYAGLEWREVFEGTLNRFRVTNLTPGTLYAFRGNTAYSEYSAPVLARTLRVEKPEAVICENDPVTPHSGVKVSWEAVAIMATKYSVEVANLNNLNVAKPVEYVVVYDGKEIETKVDNLSPDTEYQFRVRTVYNGYKSAWSYSKSIRTAKAIEPQAAPKAPWEIDLAEVKLERKIGRGSFGDVYLAWWAGTLVAVKKLHAELAEPEDISDFTKEVGIMASLSHRNVVQFHGASVRAPELFVVTEFMERGDLYHVLKDNQINLALKIGIAKDIARGMLYLHTRKPPILHRDIKSLNILIDKYWRAVIADFGFSRVKAKSLVDTMTGTPYWTAPEVLRCEPYNEKADVFSYGVVLWEILTQEEPYLGMHPNQVIGAVAWKVPGLRPPVPSYPPGSPPAKLADLVVRCWSDSPDHRPDFDTVLIELERVGVVG
eukprot:TRINITY_DN1279_c3_g1_i2.p1 TRINITY_DN1279_c3_g1~~TRINITY_DN1279_c3_g1_i2.p1  ORF type:complete len:809 (-),score=114.42 TRINITY_DN1279_c3_g1_i2:20-2446(-)